MKILFCLVWISCLVGSFQYPEYWMEILQTSVSAHFLVYLFNAN